MNRILKWLSFVYFYTLIFVWDITLKPQEVLTRNSKGGILKLNRPSVCLSVCLSVRPSVSQSVRQSVPLYTYRQWWSCPLSNFSMHERILISSFIYEITIDVWCVANKTLVSTTKVKVTVGVQTLSCFMLYEYRRWWSCPLWNFSMHRRIVILLSHMK
jgi:hypothetical protein